MGTHSEDQTSHNRLLQSIRAVAIGVVLWPLVACGTLSPSVRHAGASAPPPSASPAELSVDSAGLSHDGMGWIVMKGKLFTRTIGSQWRDVTPTGNKQGLAAAFALDSGHIWSVSNPDVNTAGASAR